jgi:hypothetical protein
MIVNMGGIYLREDDKLIAMTEEPYATEAVLQKLLADYPDLLAGDQTGTEPRRWLLVSQEVSLASEEDGSGRWSVDHLFLDQDAVPTIVEVKRSSDTRIRREVVGQMLEYAANAVVYWKVEELRRAFQSSCERRGADPTDAIRDHAGADADPDEFWIGVKTNLAAGRLRLVFVANEIPRELRSIVEYLNGQMSTTEVLAVEVKQYVGGGHQTLVPRLIGQTEAARQAKGAREGRQWDKASILEEIATTRSNEEAEVAARIFAWAENRGDLRFWFGKGRTAGGFQPVLDNKNAHLFPFALYTYGRVEIQFQWMARQPPFDSLEKRVELQTKLNAIVGVEIPDESLSRRPSIPLAMLANDEALTLFLGVMDWAFAQAQEARAPSGDLST